MSMFRALKAYYLGDRKWIALATFFLLTSTALSMVYPVLFRYLVDDVIGPGKYGLVPRVALMALVAAALRSLFYFLFAHFGGRVSNRIAYRLRNALYTKLQKLSFSFYDKAKTGDLMSRATSDLETVRHFYGHELPNMFNYVGGIVFAAALMLTMSWQLTLYSLISLPLLVLLALLFQRKIEPAFRRVRLSNSGLSSAAQENISGVRTVKAFARERHEIVKFDAQSTEYKEANVETASIISNYLPLMELAANLCVVILLGAGGYLVFQDQVSLGELVAFCNIIWTIIGSLWHTGYHINVYTQTKAACERIVEILHQHVHVKNGEHPITLPAASWKGHVRFEDVSFSYDGSHQAISHIDIDAPSGAVIGILGGTGSGKTSIVQLLMRAYNVKSGRLTIDGIDVRDIDIHDLRREMAFVFQETFLFSSTIRNNIAYGSPDADQEQIEWAAKLAMAHDFISELPEGYDTVVGERGLGLSGGQKQRIAIARALLKRPKLLVLDDATSAVDMETERRIQLGLSELAGCTLFLIAHRISSLQAADEIVVLSEGRIVQRGMHGELLQEKGIYANTYRIQADIGNSADGAGFAGIEKERPDMDRQAGWQERGEHGGNIVSFDKLTRKEASERKEGGWQLVRTNAKSGLFTRMTRRWRRASTGSSSACCCPT